MPTSSSTLPKKLQIKPGQRGIILNAPEGYLDRLTPLPDGFEIASVPEHNDFDFVQLFVRSMSELQASLSLATDAVRHDALLWICYPKGSKKAGLDLNRDSLWEAVTEHNLTGVSLISLDDTWSAMRFRPTEKVESRRA